MATEDLYKSVNWNDGEDVTFGDLNDNQRFLASRLNDQVIENLIGSVSLTSVDMDLNGQRGANAPTHLAYCLHAGAAYLRQGSAPNKIQIAPGVLLQKIANATGNEPTLLAYTFTGTEEVTIANGDATNPRVDILQMQLAYVTDDPQSRDFKDATTGANTTSSLNKKRRVQCTLSIKQGTPAASPRYPDPEAGYVCVAGILVGQTFTGAFPLAIGEDGVVSGGAATVHDQRMPLNVQGYRSDPATYKPVASWTVSADKLYATSSNASNSLLIPCPKAGKVGRLVGFSAWMGDTGTPTVTAQLGQAVGTTLGTPTAGLTFAQMNATAGLVLDANGKYQSTPYYTFEGNHSSVVGPTILPSLTNKIGPPLWTNGFRAPRPAAARSAAYMVEWLMAKIASGSATTAVYDAHWYIAEGM